MRLEKVTAILNLARQLAGSAEGMSIDEIAESMSVSRRTAERMRDAVEVVFGPLDWIDDGRKRRFRIVARGLGNFAVAPTAEELLELENAIRFHDNRRDRQRAGILRSLATKIQASLREGDRRRLATDVEALVRSETFARQVGPRPATDPEVLSTLRQALLMQRVVTFSYASEDVKNQKRTVVPYGILFASRYYLVGCVPTKKKPVLFRLDRIREVVLSNTPGIPPQDFDLSGYANQSFSVYQEEPEQIKLQFRASAARDARAFIFHSSQTFTDEKDGSVTVSFRVGGLLQLAQHLMTWGDAVTVFEPQRLRDILSEEVNKLYNHYVSNRKT